jgi:S-formylglutathione hydrolase FrmB
MFAPALAAVSLLALGSVESSDYRITVMRDRLIAESPMIRTLGVNPYDFVFRLDYLTGRLSAPGALDSTSPVRADLEQQTKLELKLDAELLVNLCPVFGVVSGLDESFYNDDPRAPPDPVAFYVPKPGPDRKYALVVVLHGRMQTETDVVSHAMLRDLADRNHAILVAPWGEGFALWGDLASSEVLAIVGQMMHAFPVDSRRVFVAGIGEGGSGAFHLAAHNPSRFDAMLSIGGELASADSFTAIHTLRNRNVYLIGGTVTNDLLSRACLPVSHYTAPDRADMYQAGTEIAQAWNDMFDGVVRDASSRECTPLY